MKLQEIIGLHNHVIEFQEGKALFHAVLVALSCQHTINSEVGTHLTKQINIVQLAEPITVIYHQCLAITKVNKACHLLLELIAVILNILIGEHFAHITATRRITYSTSTAAYKTYWSVTGLLKVGHNHKSKKVTYMKAVSSWIKTNVEGNLLILKHCTNFIFISTLGDVATLFQHIKNTCCHYCISLLKPEYRIFVR